MDGDRYLQSGKRHLREVKEEENGSGPTTFWKVLDGPRVIHHDVLLISDSDDESSIDATAVGSQPSTTPSVTSTTAVEDAPVILDVPNLGTMDAASKKDTRKPAAASVRKESQLIPQLNTSAAAENEQKEDLGDSSRIPGRFIFIFAAILFS